MKTAISTLALCAVALAAIPGTALAHGEPPRPPNVDVSVSPESFEVHVHSSSCGHDHVEHRDDYRSDPRDEYRTPRDDRRVYQTGGYYELRTVDVWIPEQRVEQWVPERCKVKRAGRSHVKKMKCKGGYTEVQIIPGHYEPREQWVWVSTAHRPRGVVRARY